MSQTQISLDADTLARLDRVAAKRLLSREDALREAVGFYLEETQQIAAIEEGIREADAGNFATEAEVQAAFATWGVNVR